ncbi:Kinase-like protein [Fusarium acuminatum]|uniref:Kinase-like protein n=1 Tax=Fusarium acuminatum TaxID=5515 RepID=A0ABZ2WW15_9HYPO
MSYNPRRGRTGSVDDPRPVNVARLRDHLSSALVPQLQQQAQFRPGQAPPSTEQASSHSRESGFTTITATIVDPALGGLGRRASVRTISSFDTDCSGAFLGSRTDSAQIPILPPPFRHRGPEAGFVVETISEEIDTATVYGAISSTMPGGFPRDVQEWQPPPLVSVSNEVHDAQPPVIGPTADPFLGLDPLQGLDTNFGAMAFNDPAPPTAASHGRSLWPQPSRPRSTSARRSSEEIVIALMGKTGSGKSTFISKLAAENYKHAVGHDLKSHGNHSRGVDREKQLREEPGFWKGMLEDGAKAMRHDGSKGSAQSIVRGLLGWKPTVVQIQRQMKEGMAVIDTDAGKYVNEEYIKMQQKHKEEMAALRDEIQRAEEKKKIELTNTLKKHYQKLLDEVEASKEQQAKLMAQKHASLEKRLEETETKLSKAELTAQQARDAATRANSNADQLVRAEQELRQEAVQLRAELSKREELSQEEADEIISQISTIVEEKAKAEREKLEQRERELHAMREREDQKQRQNKEADAAAVMVSTMALMMASG